MISFVANTTSSSSHSNNLPTPASSSTITTSIKSSDPIVNDINLTQSSDFVDGALEIARSNRVLIRTKDDDQSKLSMNETMILDNPIVQPCDSMTDFEYRRVADMLMNYFSSKKRESLLNDPVPVDYLDDDPKTWPSNWQSQAPMMILKPEHYLAKRPSLNSYQRRLIRRISQKHSPLVQEFRAKIDKENRFGSNIHHQNDRDEVWIDRFKENVEVDVDQLESNFSGFNDKSSNIFRSPVKFNKLSKPSTIATTTSSSSSSSSTSSPTTSSSHSSSSYTNNLDYANNFNEHKMLNSIKMDYDGNHHHYQQQQQQQKESKKSSMSPDPNPQSDSKQRYIKKNLPMDLKHRHSDPYDNRHHSLIDFHLIEQINNDDLMCQRKANERLQQQQQQPSPNRSKLIDRKLSLNNDLLVGNGHQSNNSGVGGGGGDGCGSSAHFNHKISLATIHFGKWSAKMKEYLNNKKN
ncbi:ribosomal pseudouridine synthase [Sarcoptes scabiei]|nr:ribosomal pseudouridine synthase [Sarcoptes scabiei]